MSLSCFLPAALLKKPSLSGQISLKMTRPAVVSMTRSVEFAVDGLLADVRILEADPVVRPHLAIGHRELDFRRVREERQPRFRRRARGAPRILRQVIAAERDVLRRRRDRLAARGREDVVRREHEHARFHLRFDRERHVHGHLVAVEVRVVSGANERMNADRFAFDEQRLESLDRKTVQGRRAVEQHRVALGDFFEDVPDFRRLALDHLLRAAHGVDVAEFLEAANDERLEQNERHLLRQTALVQLQLRPDDDDGTARVIDALAEQVLAETSALALEHVAERFQRAIAGAGDGAAMAAVVEQRIDRFLQHALFVADDDVRRLELEQVLQPVVAVDDAAIKIVQIGGREPAAFERNERTQIRRDHRQHIEHHPFGTGVRRSEALHELEALRELLANLFALRVPHRLFQLLVELVEVDLGEKLLAPLPRPSRRRILRRIVPALRDIRLRSGAASWSAASCPDR